MAHDLDLSVTAEGVEDEDTLRRLAELGCDEAQGYFFAKPLPLPALMAWFEEQGIPRVDLRATPDGDGWRINGVKTWCTFGARADVLMLLARTDPDRTKTHRGLSLFIVPKPRGAAHGRHRQRAVVKVVD